MSNTWPPQREPPPQARRPQSRYPSQPPSSDEADSGYGRYGVPGPSSRGRAPQWSEPRSPGGGAPAPEQYPPGYPSPYYPQYPEAPRGTRYPYGTQDPYGGWDPYRLRDPYGSQPPPPSPRSGFSLVEVVLLLVIAMVITAGGTWALTRYGPFAATATQPTTVQGTATSQAAGTPAAGFRLYTSTTLGVQFDMPDGWITQDIGTSTAPAVQATSLDGKAGMAVGVAVGKTGNNAAAANAGMAGVADPGTLDINEGPSQVTFGGATWVREAGDLTHSGVRLHVVVFVATHGLNTYLLTFIATISTFAATNARYFQAMTQSFQFLS